LIGFLIVDKEAGWTSHDVVARCRRILGVRRVGHAGTLDPGATGVLVIGVGPATRLLRYLSGSVKEYRAEMVLGATTSTGDEDGALLERFDMSGVGLEEVRAAASAFIGEIDQQVPMVSAVKVGGQRLYRLARQGVQAPRPTRRVRVDRLAVGPGPDPATFSLEVTCSAGTYVRALVTDLGAALGGGAYLRRLRRVRAGRFGEADARSLSEIEAACAAGEPVLREPLDALELPSAIVPAELCASVRTGQRLPVEALGAQAPGPVALADEAGRLLGIYETVDGEPLAHPAVVLAAR
jgi:tRNA pseudouridine55 synthase